MARAKIVKASRAGAKAAVRVCDGEVCDMHDYSYMDQKTFEKAAEEYGDSESQFGGHWFYVSLTEEECEHIRKNP